MPIRSGASPRAGALAVEARQLVEHRQRAVEGVDGVIAVGERRAEVRHDPVADELVQGAAVVKDFFDHVAVVLVQQADDLGGRQRARHRREVANVREQHGQLLRVGRAAGAGLGLQPLGDGGREVAPQALALSLLDRRCRRPAREPGG